MKISFPEELHWTKTVDLRIATLHRDPSLAQAKQNEIVTSQGIKLAVFLCCTLSIRSVCCFICLGSRPSHPEAANSLAWLLQFVRPVVNNRLLTQITAISRNLLVICTQLLKWTPPFLTPTYSQAVSFWPLFGAIDLSSSSSTTLASSRCPLLTRPSLQVFKSRHELSYRAVRSRSWKEGIFFHYPLSRCMYHLDFCFSLLHTEIVVQ